MRRRKWLLVALVLGVAGIVAAYFVNCGDTSAEGGRTDASTKFEPNKSLFAAVGGAEQLALYEGLPHQNVEGILFQRERTTSRTIRLHGFLFYRAPLDVRAEDVAKLRDLLGSEKSFLAWRGEKKCGGFHPDYLAEWRKGADTYRALICFGCGEVKVYSPTQGLRCDMENEPQKQLEELLKQYRKNRPAREES